MDKRTEIISTVERRRRWMAEEKLKILDEALSPGATIAAVAHATVASQSAQMPSDVAQAPLPPVPAQLQRDHATGRPRKARSHVHYPAHGMAAALARRQSGRLAHHPTD